jgi:hypothetical protein
VPQIADGFAPGGRIAERIGRPAVQGRALDGGPRLHFPIAEIHFPQPVVMPRRGVQGGGEFATAPQGAAVDGQAGRKLRRMRAAAAATSPASARSLRP